MGFIFEEGEEVTVGPEGDHNFEFAEGESVTDAGQSEFVFVEDSGLGGGSVVMDGLLVGFYETAEDHKDWYGGSGWNEGDNVPEGTAVKDYVVDNKNDYVSYFFVHHDTSSDSWLFGFHASSDDSNSRNVDQVWDAYLTGDLKDNLVDPADSPYIQDDPGSNEHNRYTTDGSGNPIAGMGWSWGWSQGDGFGYRFQPGSFSFTVSLEDTNFWDADDPIREEDYLRMRGTQDSKETAWNGYGTSFEVSINV